MDIEHVNQTCQRIREQTRQVVMGQEATIDLMLIALICEGHVLLEGVPGTAKTLLARTFAATLDLEFRRIQFTPDLMPGDVIGTNLYNFQTNSFTLTKGPVFTDVLLADEINRTPPKTQAALLEAMQERTVTIDSTSYSLGEGFLVIATQNPIEQQGTYPLPEAQLDRFLFKIIVDYPDAEQEKEMVRLHGHRSAMPDLTAFGLEKTAGTDFMKGARERVAEVVLNDELVDYIVKVVRATRESPSLLCGASPRAANMLAVAARSKAVLDGRPFALPDDVKELALPILRHRLPLAPAAEIENISVESVLTGILEQVPVPR